VECFIIVGYCNKFEIPSIIVFSAHGADDVLMFLIVFIHEIFVHGIISGIHDIKSVLLLITLDIFFVILELSIAIQGI
jgi:hypothetical protein